MQRRVLYVTCIFSFKQKTPKKFVSPRACSSFLPPIHHPLIFPSPSSHLPSHHCLIHKFTTFKGLNFLIRGNHFPPLSLITLFRLNYVNLCRQGHCVQLIQYKAFTAGLVQTKQTKGFNKKSLFFSCFFLFFVLRFSSSCTFATQLRLSQCTLKTKKRSMETVHWIVF